MCRDGITNAEHLRSRTTRALQFMIGWLNDSSTTFPDIAYHLIDGNEDFPSYLVSMLAWFFSIGFPQYAAEVKYNHQQILID